METIRLFHTGGFVMHRVELSGYKGRFSGWFSEKRVLVDAEQFVNGSSATRSVKRDGPCWKALETRGANATLPTTAE